jgi:hypothetical protein
MPGYNNWLNLSLSKDLDNSQIPFEITFCVNEPIELDFNKASDQAAKLIADNHDNIHLCLSGGLDSEYVAKVLLRNKIPFTPVVTLINGRTQMEYAYAWYFCRQHNLSPIILDYRDRHEDLYKQILAEAFRIRVEPNVSLVTNVVANQFPTASIVTGNGITCPVNYNSDLDQPLGNDLEFVQHDWYLDISKPSNPGAFFAYTPSVLYSFINSIDTTVSTQLAKSQLYDLSFRPKMYWDINSIMPNKLSPIAQKYQKPGHLCQYIETRSIVLNTLSAAFRASSHSAAYAKITTEIQT